MSRAVFLDRDGTLIQDQKYDFRPDTVRFLKGVLAGLRQLRVAGYRLIVVTNQSGVARGYFGEEHVQAMHRHLADALAREEVPVDAFYYCPHLPEGSIPAYAIECDCRKPQPGMLLKAAKDLDLDLRHSWMIGDIYDDVEAGQRAGCRTILVDPDEARSPSGRQPTPTFVVSDFGQATRLILNQRQGEPHEQGHRCHSQV